MVSSLSAAIWAAAMSSCPPPSTNSCSSANTFLRRRICRYILKSHLILQRESSENGLVQLSTSHCTSLYTDVIVPHCTLNLPKTEDSITQGVCRENIAENTIKKVFGGICRYILKSHWIHSQRLFRGLQVTKKGDFRRDLSRV